MMKSHFNHYDLFRNFERLTSHLKVLQQQSISMTGHQMWVRIRSPEHKCRLVTSDLIFLPSSNCIYNYHADIHDATLSGQVTLLHVHCDYLMVKLQGQSTWKVVMGKLTFLKLKNRKRVVAAKSWKPSRHLDSMDIHDGHKQVIEES